MKSGIFSNNDEKGNFRPVICLKRDIQLQKDGNAYKIVSNE